MNESLKTGYAATYETLRSTVTTDELAAVAVTACARLMVTSNIENWDRAADAVNAFAQQLTYDANLLDLFTEAMQWAAVDLIV